MPHIFSGMSPKEKATLGAAVAGIAVVFVGVARPNLVVGAKDMVVDIFDGQPDATERLQNGQARVVHASDAEAAIASIFKNRFHFVSEASGEFFLIGKDAMYAIACEDAPDGGGYDDESVVMRPIGPAYNPVMHELATTLITPSISGDKEGFVFVVDQSGPVNLSQTLAGEGGSNHYEAVSDVLVEGMDQPGYYYTGFRLYKNTIDENVPTVDFALDGN